jgi:hypothetical protein
MDSEFQLRTIVNECDVCKRKIGCVYIYDLHEWERGTFDGDGDGDQIPICIECLMIKIKTVQPHVSDS